MESGRRRLKPPTYVDIASILSSSCFLPHLYPTIDARLGQGSAAAFGTWGAREAGSQHVDHVLGAESGELFDSRNANFYLWHLDKQVLYNIYSVVIDRKANIMVTKIKTNLAVTQAASMAGRQLHALEREAARVMKEAEAKPVRRLTIISTGDGTRALLTIGSLTVEVQDEDFVVQCGK